MKRPGLKRPAAACAERAVYEQSMEMTHDGSAWTLGVFRDKVRAWARGTLENKVVTLAFTSNNRSGAHGFYDRFYCKSCQDDCRFHGIATYDPDNRKVMIRATKNDTHGDFNACLATVCLCLQFLLVSSDSGIV